MEKELLKGLFRQIHKDYVAVNRMLLSQYKSSLALCDSVIEQLEINNKEFNEVLLTQHTAMLDRCGKLIEKLGGI